MKLLSSFLCILVLLHCSYAPPVTQEKKDQDSEVKDDLEEYMEYHRYLKEVVQALESDPDFRERLEKADEGDVRSGKIAEQLDFVHHNVRTKLDEIKRRELERLRHLATKQYEMTLGSESIKVTTNEHLDHSNPHTFEIEDLKKLIKKTTSDLELADKQRKDQFKEYEMQKEFEKHQKLDAMDDSQKKEYTDKLKEEEDAKKHHQPLHHPGTREQLLEIWKSADNMDLNDFNLEVFFTMHDVDGNGVWDADEVKALFIKELDKLYGPGGPNKDLHERAEEMERMREHVFKENDHNRDGLIDFEEFMLETQQAEFNKDDGWKSIDENQIYTQTEYDDFQKKKLEELKYLQQRGLLDAHFRPLPGSQTELRKAQQQYQAYQLQLQQHYHGQQPYYPPGQMPQDQPIPQTYQQGQTYQQVPQGYQGQYQVPPQGQFQAQQPPQGQFQSHQPPQGHYQGQQPPQGQYQAPSQGQYQGQPEGQGQFQAQQPPQGQYQGQAPQQPTHNINMNQGQAPQVQPIQNQAASAQPQQVQGQPQQLQNQAPSQGQVPPHGQAPQGQVLPQGQPPQGQAPQAQVSAGQTQSQVPPANVGSNH